MLLTGMVFMVAGIAFKFGAAPFHMWLPDVYHGAPTADHAVHRLGAQAGRRSAWPTACSKPASARSTSQWQLMLAGLAALSLVIGNLIALAQTNLKRMLAYSTVSHVGFLFLGLAGGGARAMPRRCSTRSATR